MHEEAIFADALMKAPGAERQAFLAEACGGDVALRQRLDQLLAADGQAGGVLERGPDVAVLNLAQPEPPLAADRVFAGRFKLREKLGEGGMGEVWVADQTEPVRRRVALKVIRSGLDSARLLARFDQERQALALMDHPNIAKVLDAGVDEAGRPYFAMELIEGVPITKYCDEARLSPAHRLELFLPVCHAVQHAHQKGVIHRDLKPSNLLVALYDGRPVPKVIDFGVAKATGPRLTEQSIDTEVGSLIGTLEYMSPEQAELHNLDIDTRADIYSLGVVLYELLTATVPFPRRELQGAPFTEMLRIIREAEPPRPSTRLWKDEGGRMKDEKRARAGSFSSLILRPSSFQELDWIVLKCLEKDRNRRYATANGLARDVQRYLIGEAVEACPPSTAYRLRKFTRKYRAAIMTAATVALLLLSGVAISTWQAIRAKSAEEKMRLALNESRDAKAEMEKALEESVEARRQAEAVSKYLVQVFRTPDPRQDGWNVKVADLLERVPAELDARFANAPKAKAELLHALGSTYQGLRLFRKAVDVFEKAHALRQATLGPNHVDTLQTARDLAAAYRGAGQPEAAIALAEQTLTLQKTHLGADHRSTLATAAVLSDSYRTVERSAEAIQLLEPSLQLCKSRLGTGDEVTLKMMNDLALAYRDARRLPEAVSLFEEAVRVMKAHLGPDGLDTLVASNNLGDTYRMAGQHDQAVRLLEASLKLCRTKLGPDNPATLETMNNLGLAYRDAERLPEAEALLQKTLGLMTAKLGPDDRETLNTANNLAEAYLATGRPTLAISILEPSLPRCRTKLGPKNGVTVTALYDLAWAYAAANEPARAAPLSIECVRLRRQRYGTESIEFAGALGLLGRIRLLQENYTEAEAALRECLAIREQKQPASWSTFIAQSMLGGALLGQKKCAEAEPLLQAGYEGMKQRAAQIPPRVRQQRLTESLERLVQLYEATGQKDKADAWRKKWEQAKAPSQSTAD